MHIVYLHQYFFTPDQPGGTRSYEMARRLVAAGHRVDMITSDQQPVAGGPDWRVTEEAGIRVHWKNQPYNNSMGWLDRIKAFFGFAIAASRRAASFHDADVIFATSTPLTIAIPAIYASWRLKKPYVFEVRDVWPAVPIALGALNNPILRWLALRLEHEAYHRAARVVALAPGMGDEVASTDYPRDRITIIPNGCDNDIFGAPPPVDALADYAEWLGDRPLIIFAGTLGKANKVGYLADVAAAMLKRDPEVRFAIIGAGADRDAIAQHAANLGVLDHNLKLVPAVPKRILAGWIQRASICLAMFSGPPILWKDAVQNKFFDSLSAGKPVFSNHAGWQCHIAIEHDIGGSMSPDDPDAAAETLLHHARDSAWLAGAAQRTKALAHGRFSRNNLARELENCLSDVVRNDKAN
ncbi:Glycosyltransferase involved in cell wall bisynthesis [Sphingopyxis sp. YR583]|uniref:glycosyltransferase family 4 protein n=1 Tax=Sphingopyxis sp. YR583 TaxID=1881047 RepID=UPI0008A77566|nr:glycosyltransferase family 4 protein [Sphingopyxis sp. YR583]SEH18278.1 Glycosyltransferase involved in cell wall bisynthesis [Sphingopyxis sp. YR583]